MKKIAAFITGLFLCSALFAQTNEFKDFCKRNAESKIVRGDFELVQYNEKNKDAKRKSEGTFTLSEKDGIIWFTKKPVAATQVMMSTKIIQEVRGRKKIIDGKENPTFLSIAKITSSVFAGDYAEIEKNFDIEVFVINKFLEDGREEYDVELTPKKDSAIVTFIKKISLSICVYDDNAEAKGYKTCYISEFSMTDSGGGVSQYTLNNQIETDTLNTDEQKYFRE